MDSVAAPSGVKKPTVPLSKEQQDDKDNTEAGSDDNSNYYEYVVLSSLPWRITYIKTARSQVYTQLSQVKSHAPLG